MKRTTGLIGEVRYSVWKRTNEILCQNLDGLRSPEGSVSQALVYMFPCNYYHRSGDTFYNWKDPLNTSIFTHVRLIKINITRTAWVVQMGMLEHVSI